MNVFNVISALRASAPVGMSTDDIAVVLTGHTIRNEAERRCVDRVLGAAARVLAGTNEAICSSRPGRAGTRYTVTAATVGAAYGKRHRAPVVLVEQTPRVVAASTIPSVTRRVSGDLGLGATPGAMVSVARLSFLDGHP